MISATSSSLHGVDPLAEKIDAPNMDLSPFEAATQRAVLNILKSYTGYFDVFSELIQNALDAIDARKRAGDLFDPKVKIEINIAEGTVTVSDNGIGMDEGELRFCFRPSVSFKSRRESRGHKGVGATFLAYGFESISIWTSKDGKALAVRLPNGRVWAESTQAGTSRPTLEDISLQPTLEPGTTVKIVIGRSNRPDLTWWGASSAWQWLEILRIKTPLGGIYLKKDADANLADRNISIEVVDNAGNRSHADTKCAEYLYPHDLPVFQQRIQTVKDLRRQTQNCLGDPGKIPADCKNLSAIWEIWTAEDIVADEEGYWGGMDDGEKRLLLQHDVTIYAFFASSAKGWSEYQGERLKIRRAPILLKGGYQIATDYMVQGDLNVIPLTSTIGYQANTHIVIHFKDGNPDMGRKVFQPEIKELSEKCSRTCVNIFKRFLFHLREDTGAPSFDDAGELYQWQKAQEKHADEAPLPPRLEGHPIYYESVPQAEQDVIAVFHQLIGTGLLKGYRFLALSQIERYDGCIKTDYTQLEKDQVEYSDACPLGVNSKVAASKKSPPLVLEFKSELDALIADFEKEKKFIGEVDLVVCWSIGKAANARYRVHSYLIGSEGSNRRFFGATHAVFLEKVFQFEVVCLGDLFSFFSNRDKCVANQRLAYCD